MNRAFVSPARCRRSGIAALLVALLALLMLAGCRDPVGTPVIGTLERDRIALTAEKSEPLISIEVAEGERVSAGDVVVRLDPDRAKAERARLRAEVERARRRLDELLRGPRQEVIDEARARLAAAESALATAREDYERVRRLSARKLASESEFDAARNAREQARGEFDAARAALAALVEGTTVEQLDQARAELRAAEAALRRQILTVQRLTVTSPRAARVEALPFEVGETPRAGEPVAVLRAIDQPPYARVYVPAELYARFRPGMPVRVEVDHHGRFRGRVRFISGEAAFTPFFALTEHDAGRLSYLAEIDLVGADELPAGIPVRVVVAETGDE